MDFVKNLYLLWIDASSYERLGRIRKGPDGEHIFPLLNRIAFSPVASAAIERARFAKTSAKAQPVLEGGPHAAVRVECADCIKCDYASDAIGTDRIDWGW